MPGDSYTGARIRRARKLLHLTQAELASKVGVSRNAVDSWENNRSYPKRYDVALEQVLGIRLDEAPELDELVPQNEWERATLANEDLPDDVKRAFILDWRRERAAYKAQQREGRETRLTAGRHAAG